MYLPATELQLHRGQFTCPYCIMDFRDQERRETEKLGKSKNAQGESTGGSSSEGYIESERCERCGRTLSVVYYFNGKNLCETCVEQEKKSWKGVGGEQPPMAMFRIKESKANDSLLRRFLESLIRRALEIFRIKLARKSVEQKQSNTVKNKQAYQEFDRSSLIEGHKKKKEEKPEKEKALPSPFMSGEIIEFESDSESNKSTSKKPHRKKKTTNSEDSNKDKK